MIHNDISIVLTNYNMQYYYYNSNGNNVKKKRFTIMQHATIQTIKTLIMGLGIMNILFGFAMSAYLELPGKIMISSGVGLIAIYFLIYIWQLPEEPSKKPKTEKVE